LVSEGKIELRRFGVFGVKHQGPRVITLPSGKKVTRPAQRVITFNPSPTVKQKLNPPTKTTTKRCRARKGNLPVARSKF
jgi:nucleoid DNA-binding protein